MQTTRRGAVLRDAQGTEELCRIIENIAPKASQEARKEALERLEAAIDSFRLGYPYVENPEGTYRVRESVSEHRDALRRLSNALNDSIEALKTLPPATRATLSRRVKSIHKLISRTERLAEVAADEHLKAVESKDHIDDDNPPYLAFAVAGVLRDTLGVKITLSSDRATTNAPRNGAAYARLLRATLEAAGANTPDDLFPLINAGKRLLKEHGA